MVGMPWFAVIVGLLLIGFGIWLLLGHNVSFPLMTKFAVRIGDPREMSTWGFFLFGVAFGATSLGCTLPIFLAVVGSSVTTGDILSGLKQFLSYVLGLGLIVLILTIGIAVVKKGFVVGTMRRVVPYVQKISAVFLLTAGAYIIYYWLSSGLLWQA